MRDDDRTGPPTRVSGRMGLKDPAGISGPISVVSAGQLISERVMLKRDRFFAVSARDGSMRARATTAGSTAAATDAERTRR